MCLVCPFYTTLDKAIITRSAVCRQLGAASLLNKSMELQQVCWPTLASHWIYTSASMMHDIMHNTVGTLLWSMWLLWTQPHMHSCPFHISCTTTIYDKLFFLWNTVPVSALTLSISKFYPALYALFKMFVFLNPYFVVIAVIVLCLGKHPCKALPLMPLVFWQISIQIVLENWKGNRDC